MFVRHDIVVALDASTGELLWYYIIYRSFTRPPQCVAGRGVFIIGESEWLLGVWWRAADIVSGWAAGGEPAPVQHVCMRDQSLCCSTPCAKYAGVVLYFRYQRNNGSHCPSSCSPSPP